VILHNALLVIEGEVISHDTTSNNTTSTAKYFECSDSTARLNKRRNAGKAFTGENQANHLAQVT
jgi:hypothetical protein